jgi:hypothetical protein
MVVTIMDLEIHITTIGITTILDMVKDLLIIISILEIMQELGILLQFLEEELILEGLVLQQEEQQAQLLVKGLLL